MSFVIKISFYRKKKKIHYTVHWVIKGSHFFRVKQNYEQWFSVQHYAQHAIAALEQSQC